MLEIEYPKLHNQEDAKTGLVTLFMSDLLAYVMTSYNQCWDIPIKSVLNDCCFMVKNWIQYWIGSLHEKKKLLFRPKKFKKVTWKIYMSYIVS